MSHSAQLYGGKKYDEKFMGSYKDRRVAQQLPVQVKLTRFREIK